MAKWAFLEEPSRPTNKNELAHRWSILVLLCVGLFGSYYVYDIPAAAENQMAAYWGDNTGNSTSVGDDDGGANSENSFSFKFKCVVVTR